MLHHVEPYGTPFLLWFFRCGYVLAILMSMQSVRAKSPWRLTPHSEVGFHIDTFGMTFVKGKFEKVQSNLQFDLQQPEQATAEVILDIHQYRQINHPSNKWFWVQACTCRKMQNRDIYQHAI